MQTRSSSSNSSNNKKQSEEDDRKEKEMERQAKQDKRAQKMFTRRSNILGPNDMIVHNSLKKIKLDLEEEEDRVVVKQVVPIKQEILIKQENIIEQTGRNKSSHDDEGGDNVLDVSVEVKIEQYVAEQGDVKVKCEDGVEEEEDENSLKSSIAVVNTFSLNDKIDVAEPGTSTSSYKRTPLAVMTIREEQPINDADKEKSVVASDCNSPTNSISEPNLTEEPALDHTSNELRDLLTETVVRLGPPLSSSLQSHSWPIDKFCDFLQDSTPLTAKPFESLICNGINLTDCPLVNVCDDISDVDEAGSFNLWNSIGKNITSIRFYECTFNANYGSFLKLFAEKLPNLKSLELIDSRLSTGANGQNEFANIFYLDHYQHDSKQNLNLNSIKVVGDTTMCTDLLLLMAPNLEILQTNKGLHFYRLSRICRLNRRFLPLKLKHLDVMDVVEFFGVSLSVSAHLSEMQLQLEYLSVTIRNTRYTCNWDFADELGVKEILLPVVNSQKDSLKILKVFRPPVYRTPLQCPFNIDMPLLEELHLSGNLVHNLDFLAHMPKLKVLYIDYCCYDTVDKMRNLYFQNGGRDLQKFQNCYEPYKQARDSLVREDGQWKLHEKLERLHLNVELHPFSFQTLSGRLPNLKVLKTVLWNPGFRMVCKWMPNLEELVLLFGSSVDDDTVTGLEDGKSERRPDNITALRKLRRFELKVICDWNENFFGIGEKSVREGFLKMGSLEYVNICVHADMDLEAELDLRRNVSVVKIVRHGEEGVAHDFDECCRVKYTKGLYEGVEEVFEID